MTTFSLPVFDDAKFAAAYAAFHSDAPVAPPQFATIEYMAALMATMREGGVAHNVSLVAIERMPADVADFAKYGDFRNFEASPEFLADVAANVAEIIGTGTRWFEV